MSGQGNKWTSGQVCSHNAVWAEVAHRQAALEDGRAGGVSMSLEFFVSFFVKKKRKEKNHLDSYNAITSSSGKVLQRNHFDAWGNPLPVYASNDTLKTTPLNFTLTNRGFTGHEHYTELKIINMNARLYDPIIGRFFSPDKYVFNSSFTQDFNRYTYARNNPLMYTDPDGELIWLAPLIGLAVGAVSYTVNVATSPGGFQNWNWGQFAFSTLLGGATGAISAGVGGAVGGALASVGVGGIAGGAISGAAAGLTSGTINGLVSYSITDDKNAIWKSALIGMGMGAATGALTGMFDALSNDKNVWLGRDRAMGRKAWSFKNTDLKPNYNWKGNTHYGERSRGMVQTRNLSQIDRYSKALANNKTNIISDIENWICASSGQGYPTENTIFTGNMVGRGEGVYSGWVPEGHQLHINFDGQNVLTLSPGNYPNTIINIPSSTTVIDMFYTGSYPSYMQGMSGITEAPFRFLIYGVWR